MMKKLLFGLVIILCIACNESIPENARKTNVLPNIFPDYTEVTIPQNIAPLRFMLKDFNGDAVCKLSCGENQLIEKAQKGKFLFDEEDWKDLLGKSVGKTISATVYAKEKDEWIEYKSFNIYVAKENIDSHIAYRLLPPGYEFWLELGIYQRDITNFTEKEIAVNRLTSNNCMNCHSFCMQNPDKMMLHMRAVHAGTYIYNDGKLDYVKGNVNDSVPSLVYPSWHPNGRYIAFSTNDIHQVFHMQDKNRIEVYDTHSDVLVYDIEKKEAFSCPSLFSKKAFETFPTFSPDGKYLYYCTADSVTTPEEFNKAKYSLCRIECDVETRTFGSKVDTLYNARIEGRSAKFPRVSPDGRFLVYTLSDYGNFSIWHHDADLFCIDLKTGDTTPLAAANSNDTESYHSWSNNSHWLVFSSRRDNGLYTRPYFTYIDKNGKAHKPFMLPQADPEFYDNFMYSYNIPEMIQSEVKIKPREIADFARKQ